MDENLVKQLVPAMKEKSSEELALVCQNAHGEWTEEAVKAATVVMKKRGATMPNASSRLPCDAAKSASVRESETTVGQRIPSVSVWESVGWACGKWGVLGLVIGVALMAVAGPGGFLLVGPSAGLIAYTIIEGKTVSGNLATTYRCPWCRMTIHALRIPCKKPEFPCPHCHKTILIPNRRS